jgi:hypothetical protein
MRSQSHRSPRYEMRSQSHLSHICEMRSQSHLSSICDLNRTEAQQCVQVHDRAQGTQATLQKEELQKEIKAQQDLGYDGLLEEYQYLAEVNLDDLESSSGKRQEYWLVAICPAREACLLRGGLQPQECCNR